MHGLERDTATVLNEVGRRLRISNELKHCSQVTVDESGLEAGPTRISCPLSDNSCAIRFIPMV